MAKSTTPLGPTARPVPHLPSINLLFAGDPARIITMCNQKGGVGKMTSTINLGACLAEAGLQTLVVGLDPQDALSVGLVDKAGFPCERTAGAQLHRTGAARA
jgi:chromosome partitioning protein